MHLFYRFAAGLSAGIGHVRTTGDADFSKYHFWLADGRCGEEARPLTSCHLRTLRVRIRWA